MSTISVFISRLGNQLDGLFGISRMMFALGSFMSVQRGILIQWCPETYTILQNICNGLLALYVAEKMVLRIRRRPRLWPFRKIMECAVVAVICSVAIWMTFQYLAKDMDIYPDICIFNFLSQFFYFMLTTLNSDVIYNNADGIMLTVFLCIMESCCTALAYVPDYEAAIVLFALMGLWTFAYYHWAVPHPLWTIGRCFALAAFAHFFRFYVRPLSAFASLVAAIYCYYQYKPTTCFDVLLFQMAKTTFFAIISDWNTEWFFTETYVIFIFWILLLLPYNYIGGIFKETA